MSHYLSLCFFIILTLFGGSCAFAQESLTITTYYPSPYGSYNELRVNQMSIGSGYATETLNNGNLLVEGNVGIGTASPTAKLHIGGTPGVDGIKFPDGSMQTSAGLPASGIWAQISGGGLGDCSALCDSHYNVIAPTWRTACSYTVGPRGGYIGTYTFSGGGCYSLQKLLINGVDQGTSPFRVYFSLPANATVEVQAGCNTCSCSTSESGSCTLGLWDY